MDNTVLFDQGNLRRAFTEIEVFDERLPDDALEDIAREVVRRLADQFAQKRDLVAHPSDETIADLCRALMSDDRDAGAALIAKAQLDGASHHDLCLSYLAVAARLLGVWWDQDRVSFVKVTLAAGRIYAILRSLRQDNPLLILNGGKTATLVSVPGDNHKLGVTMASELLREKGWDIRLLLGLEHDPLVNDLTGDKAQVIGISAGGKRSLPALIRLIGALRIANRSAHILVCGQIDDEDVALIGASGADFVTTDFAAAAADMDSLVCSAPGH